MYWKGFKFICVLSDQHLPFRKMFLPRLLRPSFLDLAVEILHLRHKGIELGCIVAEGGGGGVDVCGEDR